MPRQMVHDSNGLFAITFSTNVGLNFRLFANRPGGFRRILASCIAIPLASASVASAAVSQDLTLEAILETPFSAASKHPQDPSDAPSMVSSISADEIHGHGWRTLGEALTALRGIHMTYDRSYSYLGVRGFSRPGDYNNRILLLLDGTPINDGLYEQAMIGSEFPVDIALIERIDYVPGAGSVMYGGNALFGVINVITRQGAVQGVEVEVGAGYGSAWHTRATAGKRDESGRDWLVSVTRERSRGRDLFFDSYAAPGANAWSHGLDHESNDRFFARFAHGGLTLETLFHQRTKGYPGGAYAVDLDDPRSQQTDRRALLAANWDVLVDVDWRLAIRGYFSDYNYSAQYSISGALENESAINRQLGAEINLIARAWRDHTAVFGYSWRNDLERRQVTPGMDVDKPRKAFGLYMQDDWRFTKEMTLSTGLRHDHDSSGDHHDSPRIALIANPQPDTVLKLISGIAFRDPNAYETDYSYPASNLPNRALQAEKIRSHELGVERTIGKWQLAGSFFRNHVDNLIAIETDAVTGLQIHRNLGGATARGLELEARTRWGGIRLRGSMTWQRARHESGAAIANAPYHLAKLMLLAPLPGGMTLGWETHFTGRRTADTGSIATEGTPVGGHAVSHATLGGGLGRQFEWQIRAINFFDRHYGNVVGAEFSAAFPGAMVAPMPTMAQDRRGIFGRLSWKF